MIGSILSNRYKLVSELGSGGMAWVYLADDLRQERRVAVKILYPQLSQDLGFRQRFSQEAKLVMSLSHSDPEKHIVRVLDYGSDQDIHYLVMEYVPGRDLRLALKESGPLPWKDALDIARQIALALGHAYQHGIVHRDVKPENVMMLPDGAVRVLDFGVARARTSPSLTHSGFVGSPYYAAPEQAMGRRVDIRADLYSLGIVLYEMLTGVRPFQSDTPWAIVNQHLASPPPALDETYPELPKSVARLVRKAMSKQPENRFQTPAEMVEAVEAVLAGRDLPVDAQTSEREVLAPLLAGLYERARQAAKEEEWREAVDLYSQILRFDPRFQDVAEKLAEAGRQARLSALHKAAQQAMEDKNWAEALAQLDEIAGIAPGYHNIKEMRAVAQKNQQSLLYRRGADYAQAAEWQAATECLTQVLAWDPDHTLAAGLLTTVQAEQANAEARANAESPPPVARNRAARPRRRSLLWAIVAILLAALVVEGFLFYQAQQPPVVAAVPAPATATTPATVESSTALPRPSPLAVPPSTESPPSATRPPTTTPKPSRTPLPSDTPTPTDTATSTPSATATPTPSETATAQDTATVELALTGQLSLTGQIAFPRFDPVRGAYDIFVCGVSGSDCSLVATQASQPDFLPDGSQLVVHSWKPDDKGLFLLSLSGQRIWQIADLIEAARPSVDAQGKSYVFHVRQEQDRRPRLYRTFGLETSPITREANPVLGSSPSWLPGGEILYSGCLADDCGIIVTRSDGSHPRQVAAGGSEANPEASPDGQRVIFMSQRDGNWEVYIVNIDGSGLRRLTHNPANDGLPTWSPAPPGNGTSGQYIAFVSDRDGSWAVWVMAVPSGTGPDASEPQKLFALGGPLDGQPLGAAPHETHGWVEERISWAPLP